MSHFLTLAILNTYEDEYDKFTRWNNNNLWNKSSVDNKIRV